MMTLLEFISTFRKSDMNIEENNSDIGDSLHINNRQR